MKEKNRRSNEVMVRFKVACTECKRIVSSRLPVPIGTSKVTWKCQWCGAENEGKVG